MNIFPAAPTEANQARLHAWRIVLVATVFAVLLFIGRDALVQISGGRGTRPSPGVSQFWDMSAFEGAHGVLFALTVILGARLAGLGTSRRVGQVVAVLVGLTWGLWFQRLSWEVGAWWLQRMHGSAWPNGFEWMLAVIAAVHSMIAALAMWAFSGSWRVLLAAVGVTIASALTMSPWVSGQGGQFGGGVRLPFLLSAWQVAMAGIVAAWAFEARRRLLITRSGRQCLACGYSFSGLTVEVCPECGTPIPINAAKAALRTRIRQALSVVPPEKFGQWSAAIREHVAAQPAWKEARTVLAFDPMRREVDLGPLIDAAFQEGRTVAVPACDWQAGAMTPVAITSRERDLVLTNRGFREPRTGLPPVDLKKIDLVIVPGLAFDGQGRRLGRGRGFYDRLLAGVTPPTRIIAVAFDLQVVGEVPAEGFDMHVEMLITESGVRVSRMER